VIEQREHGRDVVLNIDGRSGSLHISGEVSKIILEEARAKI
jgi:hypothetical protein